MLPIIVFFVGHVRHELPDDDRAVSREVFHSGAATFGLLAPCSRSAPLSGALLAARRRRPRMRLMLVAAAFFGVLEIVSRRDADLRPSCVPLIPIGVAR